MNRWQWFSGKCLPIGSLGKEWGKALTSNFCRGVNTTTIAISSYQHDVTGQSIEDRCATISFSQRGGNQVQHTTDR